MSTEADERAAVVAAAKAWIGTPYAHRGRIKGVGVDCATLIAMAFEEAGLIAPVVLPPYSPQWHMNRDSQKYLAVILDNAPEIAGPPGPGDVVLWQFGRVFSHGAIVVSWPTIIHAVIDTGCYEDDAVGATWLNEMKNREPRPVRYFSRWG